MKNISLVFAALTALAAAGCVTENTSASVQNTSSPTQAAPASASLVSQAEANQLLKPNWIGAAKVQIGDETGYFPIVARFSSIIKDQITGELTIRADDGHVDVRRFRAAAKRQGNGLDILVKIPEDFYPLYGKEWRLKFVFGSKKIVGRGAAGEVIIDAK